MVAISLYRGNLHRVPPDVPRLWTMPPRAVSLSQFKLLTLRRSLALSRLFPPPPPPPCHVESVAVEVKGKEVEEEEEGMGDSSCGCAKTQVNDANDLLKNEKQDLKIDKDGDPDRESKRVKVEEGLKAEVNKNHDSAGEKEEKKKELENKLHILNEKKHHLVQMLKQILNAEEEIKRRSFQQSGFRPVIPLQGEAVVDVVSVARPTPKLTVDVNCCNDTNAESDDASNNSQSRQFHFTHISPSAASTVVRGITSPFQQNLALHTSRSPFATGQGQTSSSMIMGSVTASPSRFAPVAHQGHTTSVSSISVPNAQFIVSSPSPAASGGASSVFRDSRSTNPS